MKKAIVFLAEGFEEIEAITVVDYLRRANVEVFSVKIPINSDSQNKIVTGNHKISILADLTFSDFMKTFYENLPDLVYVPGGLPGAFNNADCKEEIEFLQKMFNSKKIVASICASPAVVLAKTGILKGKNWTCYPDMENNLSEYCGSEENAKKFTEKSIHHTDLPFITDENLITGRGPGTAEQFAMELVRLLCGQEIQQTVKTKSVQR